MADIQSALAQVTGLPAERFRLHTRDVGGGFGVRNEVYPENAAVLLAAKTVGRPVKWVGSRAESLANDHQGRGAVLTGTLGLDQDGHFIALRVEWLVNMITRTSRQAIPAKTRLTARVNASKRSNQSLGSCAGRAASVAGIAAYFCSGRIASANGLPSAPVNFSSSA